MQGNRALRCWTVKPASSRRRRMAMKGLQVRGFTRNWEPGSGWDRSHRSDAVVPGVNGRAKDRCRVGHPAKIRAAETRKQKHDRRDARLMLQMLAKIAFRRSGCPRSSNATSNLVARPSSVGEDTEAGQHTLQAIALNHGLRKGKALWSAAGQSNCRHYLFLLYQPTKGRNCCASTDSCRSASRNSTAKLKNKPSNGFRHDGC